MSDWVHCNKCFVLPSNSQKFYLTSCGRVYCLKCVASCLEALFSARPKEKCPFCGNPKCGTIEINSQMKPDAQIFFMDPTDVIKKQHRQLLSMVEYQKSQRCDLFTHFKNQQKKIQQMVDFIQHEMKKKQEMAKELSTLKDSNRQLMAIIQQQNVAKGFLNPSQAFRAPPTPQTMVSELSVRETPFLNTSRHTPQTVASRIIQRSTPINNNTSSAIDNIPSSSGLNTPRMLGLEKPGGSGSNPYLNVWPKNQSPMNVSPRNVGDTSVHNIIPHIKLPFRLNQNSMQRQ